MAVTTFNDVVAGLVKASTWGTEGDVTSGGINVYASSIKITANWQDFESRDFGQGGFKLNTARLALNASVDFTFDITYGQAWLAFVAGFMGTESSPAEQTASQTDYLVNHDLAASTDGLFWTFGYSIETDRTLSMYGLKVQRISIDQNLNGAGQVSVRCLADRVVEGSANTVAEITALTDYAYETSILGSIGGTNHYFRIKDYSTGVSLSSTHNKAILGYTITLERPMEPRFGLNGAASGYSLEPRTRGLIKGTLQARFNELDNATWDIFGDWASPSFKMAELFIDGQPIGSGLNSSLKYQFPYLKVTGELPPGHDVASNNGEFLPIINYNMHKAAAAPSGMSGVTNYMRLAEIHRTRSTKWTA